MRAGLLDQLDIGNLVEKIETLGRSEAAALESAYRLICMHQLQRLFQPESAASRNWMNTIVGERLQAARVLRDNPGLKPRQEELFASAYADARQEAGSETRLPLAAFPDLSPFSLARALDKHFRAGS